MIANKKGFTMVELLVAMAIMGLLIIMAFPTIRAIQVNNTNTKYQKYGDSAISAAKLYVDSYGEDMFESDIDASQLKKVYFDELVKKGLLKDINISDSTCIEESSITVVKYKDDYSYCLHLVCRNGNSSSAPIYEENNRKGSCADHKETRVNYTYNGVTKFRDVIVGEEEYYVLSPSRLGFDLHSNHDVLLSWTDGVNNYQPGDKLPKITGTVNLEASTRKFIYNIYYDKGMGNGSMDKTSCSYGSNCVLTKNIFSKDYFTFDHWTLSSDSSKTYNDEANVITSIGNMVNNDGVNFKLVATFRNNFVKIRYNANGGTLQSQHGAGISLDGGKALINNNEVFHTLYNGGSLTRDGLINWNNPSYFNVARSGYGVRYDQEWNTNSNGTGTTFNQRSVYTALDLCPTLRTEDCDNTLYVKWVPEYTLKFDKTGGSGTCSNISKLHGDQWGSLCTPTRTGYTFGGWFTEKNGAGTQITNTSTATENLTVYAKWIINKYTVTLSSGACISNALISGTNLSSGTFNYGTKITISSSASIYCQFVNWSDGISSNAREITVNGNINLTANGRYNVIYTDFYSNGGYLIPREEQVCPVIAGCTNNSNCHYTTDLPGCRNKSGLVYSGGGLNWLDTSWSTKGLRDFKEDNKATLPMRKAGCTSGSGNWHVYPGDGRDLLVNEEKTWQTGLDLINHLGEPYTTLFKTQDIRLNLYAGWKGCN